MYETSLQIRSLDWIYRRSADTHNISTRERQPERLYFLGRILSKVFKIDTLRKVERSLSPCRTVRQQDNFINNYSYERKA